MDAFDVFAQFVSTVGLPVGLVVFWSWFLAFKAWPDHKEIQVLQTQALGHLADALTHLADALRTRT